MAYNDLTGFPLLASTVKATGGISAFGVEPPATRPEIVIDMTQPDALTDELLPGVVLLLEAAHECGMIDLAYTPPGT